MSSFVGPALGLGLRGPLGHVALGHVDFHEGQLRQGLAGYLRIGEIGRKGRYEERGCLVAGWRYTVIPFHFKFSFHSFPFSFILLQSVLLLPSI